MRIVTRTPILAGVLCPLLAAATAAAQFVRAPHREWRTVETPNFVIHYHRETRAWVDSVAPLLEAVRAADSALIGWAPARRITLLVDDPRASVAGYASANVRAPVISLWPTPADPRSALSAPRIATLVHELAHIQHLARPGGPLWQRVAWRLLPVERGPVAWKTPRWMTEGYPTYLSGRVTPASQPGSAMRAAIVRAMVLDSTLPAYGAMSTSVYDHAYQLGSAFFEHLARRGGDSTLALLWRRVARPDARPFDVEFRTLYGMPPDSAYALFSAHVTARVRDAERLLRADGVYEGTAVRRAAGWQPDNTAISPDGRLVAAIAGMGGPPRLRVFRAGDLTHPIATLGYPNGNAHNAPRWLSNGKELLVTSWEQTPDSLFHPDLHAWNVESGVLRRVTRGAAIREADPEPDGRTALGTRCIYGVCDLVRVDLASGAVRVLVAGSPSRAFFRPRVSPDGRQAAATMTEGARSRVILVDLATGTWRDAHADDHVRRYEPAFFRDGRRLAYVTEAGGVPNIEVLDLGTGVARPVTRMLTAAFAPEPDPRDGSVLYVRHTSRGAGLRRAWPDSVQLGAPTTLDSSLAPAAPPALVPMSLARSPLGASRPYGVGPRHYGALPGVLAGPDGVAAAGVVYTGDIVGRLSAMVRGAYGSRAQWHGAGAEVVWRGSRPTLTAQLFSAGRRASDAPGHSALDATFRGGALLADAGRLTNTRSWHLRSALAAGQLAEGDGDAAARQLGVLRASATRTHLDAGWDAAAALTITGVLGRTDGHAWERGLATASLDVGQASRRARASVTYGRVAGAAAHAERFTLGGMSAPLFDPLLRTEQLAMPLAAEGAAGTEALSARVVLDGGAPVHVVAWAARGGGEWQRVVGLEGAFRKEPWRVWRAPGVDLAGGVGYAVDARGRGARGYVALRYSQ